MSTLTYLPQPPLAATRGQGCPTWCVADEPVGNEHAHHGDRRVFVERDADGDPTFAASVQAVEMFHGAPVMVHLRAWQDPGEGLPAMEFEHLLTALEARNLARLLVQAADEAEALA